jgi:hypothetical protein
MRRDNMLKDFKVYPDTEVMLGFTQTDIECLTQWIYNCLLTERYEYEIFTRNFGTSLSSLLGKGTERTLLIQQINDNIRDALVYDNRIDDVTDFDIDFDDKNNSASIKFNVHSIYGDIAISTATNMRLRGAA